MAMRFRLGGRADALALTSLGVSGVATSPYFAPTPTPLLVALAAAGGAWVGRRLFEGLHEKNLFGSPLNIASSDFLAGSDGLLVGYRTDTGAPVRMNQDAVSRHGLVQGGSGKGKTTFAKLLACQQIQRGGGLLLVEAKLEDADLDFIYQFAVWCGRAHDLLVISPGDPKNSHTYNPVQYGDPDEVSDRILALIPGSEENAGTDYYRQATKQALVAIVGGLKALDLAYNFTDLAILLTNQTALSELEEKLRKVLPFHDATKNLSLFLEQYKGGFGRDDHSHNMRSQINMKRLKDMLGGIANRLHTFGTGSFGNVTSSYSPQVRLFEAMRDNKIVILRLPTMGKPETSFSFAKMLLADWRTAISWLQKLPEHLRPNPSFLGLFDEFGSYALSSILQPFEQGRAAGVSLWVFLQSYAQLHKIGAEFKQIINAVTANKFFFGLGDQEGAEEAAMLIGETDVVKDSISTSARAATSTPKVAVAPEGGASEDAALSQSETVTKDFRVPPDHIKKIPRGQAIFLHDFTHLHHLRIPEIRISRRLAREIGRARITYVRTKPVRGCDYFKNADRYLTSAAPPPKKEKAGANDRRI